MKSLKYNLYVSLPLVILLSMSNALYAEEQETITTEIAMKWAIAANLGDQGAQYNLGLLSLKGEGGLPKDKSNARYWLKKSAAQGNANAQQLLGEEILGYPEEERLEWACKAAEQGNSDGQYMCGVIHLRAAYVMSDNERDKTKNIAMTWLNKSAAQGNTRAIEIVRSINKPLPSWARDKSTQQTKRTATGSDLELINAVRRMHSVQ